MLTALLMKLCLWKNEAFLQCIIDAVDVERQGSIGSNTNSEGPDYPPLNTVVF